MEKEKAMELAAMRYAVYHDLIGDLDMGQWSSPCGTAGCLAGNLGAVVPDSGIYIDPFVRRLRVGEGPTQLHDASAYSLLADYFGMEEDDSAWLFGTDNNPLDEGESTQERVHNRLSLILQGYYPSILKLSERELSEEMGIDLYDRLEMKRKGEREELWRYEPRQSKTFIQLLKCNPETQMATQAAEAERSVRQGETRNE